MLFTLTYVSRETVRLSPDELGLLARTSARENARLGVTGVLLYADGYFLQRLEGPKGDLLALYRRIQRDPRHDVLLLTDVQDLPERLFDGWGMALVDARTLDEEGEWRTLLDGLCRDPSQADALARRIVPLLA